MDEGLHLSRHGRHHRALIRRTRPAARSRLPRRRVFMTSDANAAVLGAFDAGATEVMVNDSHWNTRNLLLERLDPRARMIKGLHKPICMVQGIDSSFDAAVFVGYHSCAGTERGVLNHTLLGKEVQQPAPRRGADRRDAPERADAGHYGVPVAVRRRRRGCLQRGACGLGRRPADLFCEGRHRHVHRRLPSSRGNAEGNSGRRGAGLEGAVRRAAAPRIAARRPTGSASNGTPPPLLRPAR